MPLRFRRSIHILPGIRLNFSKRGVSTSIGVKGAHVTLGHGKTRTTVGLPGTGLSFTYIEGARKAQQDAPGKAQPHAVSSLPQPAPRARLPWAIARLAVFACILAIAGRIVWLLVHS